MILFENNSTKAAFYFAAEEYIMQTVRPGEAALMLWSTDDTVMIGANQVAGAECDGAFMKANGIALVRRSSGGGAIYTDKGTLQFTVILPYSVVGDVRDIVREWLAGPVIEAVACYGAGASIQGRNDLVIDGKKVSGMAQYIRKGYLCSHGSILFSADLEKLSRALTVDPEKIESKGVASSAARVTNISDHIAEKDISVFRETLIENFGREGALMRHVFNPEALEKIETIERDRYENGDWTYGRDPAYTRKNKKRFPGGSLEVYLDVKGGVIRHARITGDFLALRSLTPIEDALIGVPYREEEVRRALNGVNVKACLGSLGKPELLETLL